MGVHLMNLISKLSLIAIKCIPIQVIYQTKEPTKLNPNNNIKTIYLNFAAN